MLLFLLDIQPSLIIGFDSIRLYARAVKRLGGRVAGVPCGRSWMEPFGGLHGRGMSRIFCTLPIRNLMVWPRWQL